MSGEQVLSAAAEVQAFCEGQRWRFCFIGGIAVQRWGAPRFTQDVDLTLLTGYGGEEQFVDPLLRQFSGRLRDARKFALDHRVLLVRSSSGIEIDLALGALPFEEACVSRATPWQAADRITLTTCGAEDLIIHKVFSSRQRDWSDVETILARQWGRLDLNV
ncbi:MAG TPA: nucleotidyl transferase AbiEii/AbiGii toxin family protein, partial [Tepidisphaeraceae bacterium]|nr:nucleotidyl transferase AbiEii/AbiGii toxin family protein [Tepidisphaeraceae bacterium]